MKDDNCDEKGSSFNLERIDGQKVTKQNHYQ